MIDDETLDRQLRESMPYIDDDGFTAHVMASLPAVRREHGWLRTAIIIGLALIGSCVAYLVGAGHVLRGGVIELANFPIWLLLVFAFGCGLVVGAFAVIFAIRKTPEIDRKSVV